jgi:hypothetical protein
MLNAGDPPRTLETLLKHVKEMRGGGEKKLSFPRQEGFSEFLARSVYAWETTDPRGVRSSFPKYNQTLCCAPLIVEQQHFTKPDRRARFPAAME